MKRLLEESLIRWQKSPTRLPIILRGARQVGKSYLIENFGKTYFDNILVINFEKDPHYKYCFQELEANKAVSQLELIARQKITPGKTLLFLDEIQECPNAIQSLRYFKEQIPELHVISAGSLLEFALQREDFSFPVGRVQFLYLKPLCFKEFLWAQRRENLCDYLAKATLNNPIPTSIHHELLKEVRNYLILGGMPAVLTQFFQTQSLREANDLQSTLLQNYRADFGKYAKHHEFKYLETVFEKLPALTSQQIKYSKIDSNTPSRNIKLAIEKLHAAQLLTPIYATSAAGLPLVAHKNERKFKTLFIDVGLMLHACQVEPTLLIQGDILFLLQGAMMEQFVGQELLAYHNPIEPPELYFWTREEKSAQAEVDYLFSYNNKIFAIEVKSKSLGHLKSLKRFMSERHSPLGIRISEHPLSFENGILSIPLYMVFEIERLLANTCTL
jgi:predicted AAA+ superfamily ATPase